MSTSKLLLRFAKPYPGWILLTIFLGFSGSLFNGIGTALIVPVILKIVGQQVDLTTAPPILKAITSPFDNVPENYRIWVMAGAIILTIVLKNFAGYASTLASSSLTRMLTSDMREAGLQVLLGVDIDYYSNTKVGDLINTIGGEIARAAGSIGNVIKIFIVAITILVFVGFLLAISWQLTLASTVLLSLVTLVNQYAISRSKDFGKQLSDMSRAYSIAMLETLSGVRLVKATGNEGREYKRIRQLIRDREKADFQSQVNSEAIAPLSEVTGITALLLIVVLSRTFFANQISSLSTVLLTYLLVLLRLLPFISQLNSLRSGFANTSTSVDLVADFLRRDNKPFMNMGSVQYTKLQKGVHFDHISFAYPGHEKLVLKDVSLYLPRGTTLALVGSSGAGKSTIADLLPRFYDPISGHITIDGVDLREYDLQSLRKAMGIVSQDTFLFNDTVGNNIAYGKPEASGEEIMTAAKRANAYEFISKLPQEFDTLIGDRGVMLSGGQRQRLAIARALLQNPEILILDEATSALDTVSERLVQSAIDDLSRDRTTLVIAHRLSTVQKADQIAVLDLGCVVEVGTHEELLQKGSYYSRLYSMQFSERSSATSATTLATDDITDVTDNLTVGLTDKASATSATTLATDDITDVTDNLTVGLTDQSSAISATTLATDDITDVTDNLTVGLTDQSSATSATTLATDDITDVTDNLTVGLTDQSSATSATTLATDDITDVTDNLTVGLTDQSSATSATTLATDDITDVTDNLTVGLTDQSSATSATTLATDDITDVTDNLTVGLTDQSSATSATTSVATSATSATTSVATSATSATTSVATSATSATTSVATSATSATTSVATSATSATTSVATSATSATTSVAQERQE